MGYGLKRLLEIEEEKKKKREEKERIKKEKEEEKKRLKKIEHKKMLKKKQNKRAYAKRKKALQKEREENGIEMGYYGIYITKNRKRIRFVGSSRRKDVAYKIYTSAIEGNREKVKFPQTVFTSNKQPTPVKYEILLVKKIDKDEDVVTSFRDENGKYVDNVIVDWDDHVIVEKNEWLVEELFGIYGYHPRKDRKKYSFILEKLLLDNEDVGEQMRRVMVYKNKLIIQYLEDFDFVTCYDNDQCKQLYDKLLTDVTNLKKKYIVFMGELAPGLISQWIDNFENKTGWKRYVMSHSKTL